jgi:hypothetical protein
MSISNDPPPPPPGGPPHAIPRSVLGLLGDLRHSIHNPQEDLLFPTGITRAEWISGIKQPDLVRRIAKQGLAKVDIALKAEKNMAVSAQKLPERVDELRRSSAQTEEADGGRVPAGVRALDNYPQLTQSATWWTKLREGLLASDVQCEINLRTPWFTAGNQGKQASCVGHAVADLIELQRRSSFDPPSARYLWQAAKEMDGDERPTTMIAAAGTILRDALALVMQ